MQTTIDYYNCNAQDYYERTFSADMSEALDRFAKYVRPGGSVVDVGCGSGRDIRYFLDAGYEAEGVDASDELCALAREATGATITCTTIQDWTPAHAYDGIWANASLLHLTMEEIQLFIARLPAILTQDGVAYISFKSGIQTGLDDEGRYFTNMTQEILQEMIHATSELVIRECWESTDAMKRQNFIWLNVIVGRG